MRERVCGPANNNSGGVLIGLLNILHPLRISETGGFSNALNVHRFIEALKFAFGARSWVTDPAYAQMGNKERMEEVITDQWADDVRARIDDVSWTCPGGLCPNGGRLAKDDQD